MTLAVDLAVKPKHKQTNKQPYPSKHQCLPPSYSFSRLVVQRVGKSDGKLTRKAFEPPHDKTNKVACAPSEDSDQPGHPPSLIRVFAVRMKKAWVLSYPSSAQRRLWSDWADAQADRSLRWAHSHFVGFVMRRLIFSVLKPNKATKLTK